MPSLKTAQSTKSPQQCQAVDLSPQLLVLTCLVCPTSNNLIASYLSYCFGLPFPRVQDFWRAAKGKPQTPQCLNAPSCSISSAAIGANVGVGLAPVLWHGCKFDARWVGLCHFELIWKILQLCLSREIERFDLVSSGKSWEKFMRRITNIRQRVLSHR